jgi:hypothetical protein
MPLVSCGQVALFHFNASHFTHNRYFYLCQSLWWKDWNACQKSRKSYTATHKKRGANNVYKKDSDSDGEWFGYFESVLEEEDQVVEIRSYGYRQSKTQRADNIVEHPKPSVNA